MFDFVISRNVSDNEDYNLYLASFFQVAAAFVKRNGYAIYLYSSIPNKTEGMKASVSALDEAFQQEDSNYVSYKPVVVPVNKKKNLLPSKSIDATTIVTHNDCFLPQVFEHQATPGTQDRCCIPEQSVTRSQTMASKQRSDQIDTRDTQPLLREITERNGFPNESDETPGNGKWWREVRPYSTYVLFVLLLAYLFNQLDRYMLAITIIPLAQELKFGDQGCVRNESVKTFDHHIACNGTHEDSCLDILSPNHTSACKWDYNGQGWDYQILAGPVFILIYTFAGIFIGFAADIYNRKLMLACCLSFWSAMTFLTGFVTEYWQLVILRFGLGLGEAGCTPFAASLIADYFTQTMRGSAMGVYNFGIYFGYGLSYALGNFITIANINGQGWRWAFIIPGIPGVLLGILIAVTLREPERSTKQGKKQLEDSITTPRVHQAKIPWTTRLWRIVQTFLSPSLFLLCLAGSIRNAGGYVWAYNTQPYFEASNVSKETVGSYMSWIPLVGGSLGVLFGGFISDRVVKRRGLYARILVLVVSQFLAAPFAAGALFLDVPYAFISLIPANVLGEMWVGVTLAVVVELVPSHMRTSAVAFYLFIISNIGGNVPLLVPLIGKSFENSGYTKTESLRGALYILYPGLYIAGGLLFLLTMFVVKRDQRRAQMEVVNMEDP